MFLTALYGSRPGPPLARIDAAEMPEVDAFGSLSRAQLVARPHVLRRLIAPVVLTHRAEQAQWGAEFRELVIAAFADQRPQPRTFADALERLRTWARDRFAMEPRAASRRARAALRRSDPEELLELGPSHISSENGVFTVGRKACVKAPLRALREVLNPVNWMDMAEFFQSVRRLDGEFVERTTKDGWQGLFEEQYVVSWGPLQLRTCRPLLLVDFTYDDTRVRADYSLVSEVDDQLECDDGYLEARLIPGRVGWCEYYAEKSTKFRSPDMNLMAPVVLAVFLEANLSSIEDAAYDRRSLLDAGDAR